MAHTNLPPREGTLYRTYMIDDYKFDIFYGYYDENERGRVEPLPVFPDLMEQRVYAASGEMIVTALQAPCAQYDAKDPNRPEEWCGDCLHYAGGKAEIGICVHQENRREA